jgi:hypothetical protein
MEHIPGGITAEPTTAEDIRSAVSALILEERRLLSEMDRWIALFPDRTVGHEEALRLYHPKIDDVRARRKRLVERLDAAEGGGLDEVRERLQLLGAERAEEMRPGTPMKETPAVSR